MENPLAAKQKFSDEPSPASFQPVDVLLLMPVFFYDRFAASPVGIEFRKQRLCQAILKTQFT